MSRRDGTGPMGRGTMSGKGLGVCGRADVSRSDGGYGSRQGAKSQCRRGSNMGRNMNGLKKTGDMR